LLFIHADRHHAAVRGENPVTPRAQFSPPSPFIIIKISSEIMYFTDYVLLGT